MPHLPYATDEWDEFFHPTEGWLLIERTIAFDSWISWRQALPRSHPEGLRLDACTAAVIEALAERLHVLHQQLPGYSELGDTPFRFSRWWDPFSGDDWSTGRVCTFQVEGISSGGLIEAFISTSGLNHLTLSRRSSEEVTARLTGEEVDLFISGQSNLLPSLSPAARPQKKSRPRTSRTPPR
jgi:hypothetical protein